MATRSIPISQVKANLLRLVTEIADTGDDIVITRRGTPVARLSTAMHGHPLRGSLLLPDDLADLWSTDDDWRDPVAKYDGIRASAAETDDIPA